VHVARDSSRAPSKIAPKARLARGVVYAGKVSATMRELVPVEIAVVIVAAVAPLPEQLPAVLPLVVAAMLSRMVRRRGWAEVMHGGRVHAVIGVIAGAAALALAIVVGTPAFEATTEHAVEWSEFAIARGDLSRLVAVALYASAIALFAELVLRGWIVERVLELAPQQRVLAILAGAIAEAMLEPGGLTPRIGAAITGIGLGWIYVAGGRSVIAPACARLAFQIGAATLETMRIIG
jgi:hypothetical protein